MEQLIGRATSMAMQYSQHPDSETLYSLCGTYRTGNTEDNIQLESITAFYR